MIVGAGGYSRVHLWAAMRAGLRCVAVVDSDRERAEALASTTEGVTAWDDLDRALDAHCPGIVSVVVPTAAHATVAARCLERTNVLIEKPVARSVRDAVELRRIAVRTGHSVDVVSQRRYQSANRAVKRLLDNGDLGRITTASCVTTTWRDQAYFTTARWRGDPNRGGGNLLNHGLHAIDLLVWLLGDTTEFSSLATPSRYPDVDIDECLVSVLGFESGAIATVEASIATRPDDTFTVTVRGDQGSATLGDRAAAVSIQDPRGTRSPTFQSESANDALVTQYREFAERIDAGPCRQGLEAGIQTLSVAAQIVDAAELHSPGSGEVLHAQP